MLTFKFSQDHLELFFGCLRTRFGCNNNPSAKEFKIAYKKLLLHQEIRGNRGNCITAVTENNTTGNYKLVNSKDRGGLIYVNSSVRIVCEMTESTIKKLFLVSPGFVPKIKNINAVVITNVLKHVVQKYDYCFESLKDHSLSCSPLSNHQLELIKLISSCYLKIRMHHTAKSLSEKLDKTKIRKLLSKLILFKHQ